MRKKALIVRMAPNILKSVWMFFFMQKSNFGRAMISRQDVVLVQLFMVVLIIASQITENLMPEWRWIYWFASFALMFLVLSWRASFTKKFKIHFAKLFARRLFRLAGLLASGYIFLELMESSKRLGFLGTVSSLPVSDQLVIIALGTITVFVFSTYKEVRLFGPSVRPLTNFGVLNISLGCAFGLAEFRAIAAIPDNISSLLVVLVLLPVAFLFEKMSRLLSLAILLAVVFGAILLAFRTDYLTTDVYHLAYFVDVIASLKHGFTLLVNQPSQYGAINIWLPSRLPLNPLDAFHVYQSVLIILAFACSIFVCLVFRKGLGWMVVATIAILTVVLADPGMIGPNPFPSSSVVRFFPVYLLISLFAWHRIRPFNPIFALACLNAFTFYWSVEALFYIGLPSVAWSLTLAMRKSNLENQKSSLNLIWSDLIKGAGIFLSLITLAYLLIRFRAGTWGDLSMLYIHAVGYAEGLGAMPIPSFNSFSSIFILFAFVLFASRKASDLEPLLWAVGALIISLGTYYVGRAVPHNITAMMPLFFLLFVITRSLCNLKTSRRWLSNLVPVVFGVMVIMSAFSNNDRLNTGLKSAAFSVKVPEERAQLNYLKRPEFDIIPAHSPVSVVSLRYLKFLYDPENILNPSIPVPAMLLAHPLSSENVTKLLGRITTVTEPRYIIFDKDEAYKSAFSELESVLMETLRCNFIFIGQVQSVAKCEGSTVD